jgi:hypothetical protein
MLVFLNAGIIMIGNPAEVLQKKVPKTIAL